MLLGPRNETEVSICSEEEKEMLASQAQLDAEITREEQMRQLEQEEENDEEIEFCP